MVKITKTTNLLIIDVLGLHKLWALKRQLRIPIIDIVKVYQNEVEFNKFKGIRFGTHIPGIITAGTYFWKGKRNFWDVMNIKNTIIIELKNNYYTKLYLEVTDTIQIFELLKSIENEK